MRVWLRCAWAVASVACVVLGVAEWRAVQAAPAGAQAGQRTDWPVYGGSAADDRYSALTQVNRTNVKQLATAWTFDTGETGGLQTSPLIVGRVLFGITPTQKVFALDGGTGKKLWMFEPSAAGRQPARGLSYWTDGKSSVLFAGLLTSLYAIDPATGKLVESFGEGGKIDLRNDLAEPGTDISKAFVAPTTPGVVYKDMIILGFRLPETKPALHGDIRAYDVRTGKLRWTFHTIPHPGEPGYETWPADAWKVTGAANNWAGMALDEKRGIVYAPTGSAVSDFDGSDRIGDDLYANTLLALDANTGKRLWHFQDVHHDIWDRDYPSPPSLVTVRSGGKMVDAVAQTTKHGFLFLFDRVSGKPLFPITEKAFPASDVPGEKAAATQPVPAMPAPYARQLLTSDMLTNRTPEAHAAVLAQFSKMRSDGLFVPLSVGKATIVFPGYDGGAEWGGSAVDVKTGVIYVNANDVPWTGELAENKPGGGVGSTMYQSQCSVCHGGDRAGSPPVFPSLVGVSNRLSVAEIVDILANGRGRMPAFPNVAGAQRDAVIAYLHTGIDAPGVEAAPEAKREPGATPAGGKYRFTGYRKFVDPDGYPAVQPPWGTLNAIDLNTGKYLWKIPLGEYPELAAKGMPTTGSENYGGPVVTAGGVVLIGATNYDHTMRAFNSTTGELLWRGDLPYAGNATPATYMIDGKQYVVIATSNARNPKAKQGAAYVAFALP